MSSHPTLSVIMSVFNGADHLREAIESVLAQTMPDFEFLIVDDASVDSTFEILEEYSRRDDRVTVFRNPENKGLTKNLNFLLDKAAASTIARIDADDACEIDRFKTQLQFLADRPDHILVGCGYTSIDELGRENFVRRNPMNHQVTSWMVRFRMPMVHPGFCFRKSLPDGTRIRYDETIRFAQDYELAGRIAKSGKIAVLGEPLVRYRMHSGNISMSSSGEQDAFARAVAWSQVQEHYPSGLHEDLATFLDVSYRQKEPAAALVGAAVRGLRGALNHDFGSWRETPRWARRRTAGILSEAFLRGGGLKAAKLAARLAAEAPELATPFAFRFLELRGIIAQHPQP